MGKIIPLVRKRPPSLERDLDELAELQKRFSTGLDERDRALDGAAVARCLADFISLERKIKKAHKLSPQDIHRALVERGALSKDYEDPDPGPESA